ncbi:hypothetical protein NO995_07165 [Aestuariibaculum sp. M13]|uniref:hypothetical protein n=1 Tax=Aestuariibaculum sp. M13 TaxID=2967132 RepID=UPI002159DBC4|nr:hypothetical protein [Aestuariibaculum sp. M13]MCR8667453.1 hypothetical protein [Aestuariibaculum sp. M13]
MLQVHKVIPDYLRQQIESRTQTFPNPPYVANSFNIQDINEGWGKINLDKYSLNITSLPSGYSPFQLFDEIRKNLSQFIVGGDFDSVIKYGSVFNFAAAVTLEPYSPEDGVVWNSENPIGAAMDFDTFLDTSTVVCVDYSEDEMFWTFATVYSWDHSGHFVSGLRQFGLESNGQGGYSFYLRGADRLGGALDYLANGLETGNDYLYLGAGDANWKNFMELLENYLLKKPGASVEHFDKSRTYGKRHWYVEGGCP